MKKTLAILALMSLATLPSLAAQRDIYYGGYRIGEADVAIDVTRIASLPGAVTDSGLDTGKTLTATKVNGQKIVRWWSYKSKENVVPTSTTPAYIRYNNVVTNAAAVYSLNWTYNTVSYSPAYVVVDYDYIKYNLSYDRNGGSGTLPSTTNNVIYTNEVVVAGGELSRAGYTWVGWTNNLTSTVWTGGETVTGSTLGLQSIVDGSNVVLRAKWTANNYKVKFDANGGTGSMDDQSFTYDQAQSLTSNAFTRVGYAFSGWTNATGIAYADGVSVSNLATEEGAVVELFAKWTQKWSIVFKDDARFVEAGDDGVISSNVYVNGEAILQPSNPSHEGYTFNGWAPNVSSTATANATYSATYSVNHYFVRFQSNYGEEIVELQDFEYGKQGTLALQSSLFSRTGYDFAGWALSADSSEKKYDDGAAVLNLATAGTFDLYALWTPIEYTIAFDANGGSGTMAPMENIKYDTVTNLTKCGFTKQGVDFKCWTCAGQTFDDEAQVSNLTNLEGVVTMKAVWSEKCYVEYDANGGTGEMETQTFDAEDLPASLTSNAFEKVGYTFSGWATNETDAAALTVTYVDGTEFTTFASLPAAAGETATLYAVWQTNTYTVVFNPNCASYTGEMADQAFVYDQAQALTVNGFTNETGLAFAGWTNYTDNVGYADGVTVSNLTAAANGTVTLSAVWDVGELSKAMHCDNLYWENQPNATSNTWLAKYEEGIGYGTDSCVVTNGAQISYMIAGVTTNGVLSFKWKANHKHEHEESDADDRDGLKVGYYTDRNATATTFTDLGTLARSEAEAQNETWLAAEVEIEQSYFGNKSKIWLVLRSRRQSCFIDQMTWTPEGSTVEPTEENKPTISAFTATSDGFRLTAGNVSDSFSYQILATNELVGGDWPVKETLSADKLTEGYTITPDAGEPTMFYKVKVIAK